MCFWLPLCVFIFLVLFVSIRIYCKSTRVFYDDHGSANTVFCTMNDVFMTQLSSSVIFDVSIIIRRLHKDAYWDILVLVLT